MVLSTKGFTYRHRYHHKRDYRETGTLPEIFLTVYPGNLIKSGRNAEWEFSELKNSHCSYVKEGNARRTIYHDSRLK